MQVELLLHGSKTLITIIRHPTFLVFLAVDLSLHLPVLLLDHQGLLQLPVHQHLTEPPLPVLKPKQTDIINFAVIY